MTGGAPEKCHCDLVRGSLATRPMAQARPTKLVGLRPESALARHKLAIHYGRKQENHRESHTRSADTAYKAHGPFHFRSLEGR